MMLEFLQGDRWLRAGRGRTLAAPDEKGRIQYVGTFPTGDVSPGRYSVRAVGCREKRHGIGNARDDCSMNSPGLRSRRQFPSSPDLRSSPKAVCSFGPVWALAESREVRQRAP